MRFIAFVLAGLLGAAAPAGAAPSLPPPPPDARSLYRAAFAAAETGDWIIAQGLAARGGETIPSKVLTWLALLKARPSPRFEALAAFIDANPDWPRLRGLRRRAEAALNTRIAPDRVVAWFAAHPPLTALGKQRLGEALLALGDNDQALSVLRDAWITGNFTRADERVFYKRHRKRLRSADHVARLDRLLWDGKRYAARRMLRRVDKGFAKLALARLSLRLRAGGVDGAIARVPTALKDHPGLLYERLRWRRRKGLDERAREILDDPPSSLVRPEAWWREARILARRAVADGLISAAYRIAAEHHQTAPLPRAEAEWLAGWVSLRFLRDPKLAYPHFVALHDGVRYAISLSRGAYWAGRAAASAGDAPLAERWYQRASAYSTTYYGQLALAELGARHEVSLPPTPEARPEDIAFIENQEMTRVIRGLAAAGLGDQLRPFVLRLYDHAATPGQKYLVAALAVAAGRVDLGLWVARRSLREGIVMPEFAYPVVPLPVLRGDGVEPALVLAMLRQESGFDVGAISSAGARGMLQILPATARGVARKLKIGFSAQRLTSDPDYNLLLGQSYLRSMIDAYDGSYVLALAAYNAGSARVRRWIRDYGDPRDQAVDVIDWIETIPINETRNYVQRVLEAVPIYRRILGQSRAYGLARDLHRGGKSPLG